MSSHEDAIMTVAASRTGRSAKFKILVMLGICVIAIAIYARFGDWLTLSSLAGHETRLHQLRSDHPRLAYVAALAIYSAATGLSLPGAAILTLVYGWYFGFIGGLILVSFASTLGATIAFLSSRYVLRDLIESKYGQRLAALNENLKREGAFYLFTLRLIPAIPFFVINVVMGLTPMKTWTFWWVSQLGMLAGTAVYVYAGSRFPTLSALAENGADEIVSGQLVLAFAALGLFPLLTRIILKRFAAKPDGNL